MPRIFILPENIAGKTAELPEHEARRLYKVLRMAVGDPVTLIDGHREYSSRISFINSKSVKLEILGISECTSEPKIGITLGQGLPKGDKLEWVLQKSVELGVMSFVPVVMDRSVKRPEAADAEKRHARLIKIATEAVQQSGRVCVPEVTPYKDLTGFLAHTRYAGLKLLMYEGENKKGLGELLKGAGEIKSVAVLIGPEGGLTDSEVRLAESFGFISAGLGPRILRTETAGLAALSIIQYKLGDMG
jgi:16S rRNA (uracil1498-N3)-methyltransferase